MNNTVPDQRCSACNTRLWAYRMTVESTELLCPFCELHEYPKPMYDEDMTPELRDGCLDLIIKHTGALNTLLDFDEFRKNYVKSLKAEIEGLDIYDDWLRTIQEKAALIDALATRILEND